MTDKGFTNYREAWDYEAKRDAKTAILSMADGSVTPEDFFWQDGRDTVKKFLSLDHLAPQSIVVDYGCGIGRLLRPLAESRPDCTFLGLDVSPEMLNLREETWSLPNVSTLLVEGRGHIPIAGRSVDLVYSFLVLQHMRHHDAFRALTEFYQVLKPAGTAILTFPDFANPRYTRDLPASLSIANLGPGAVRPWTKELTYIFLNEAGFKAVEYLSKYGSRDIVVKVNK